MKKSKKSFKRRSASKQARVFRAGVLAGLLLAVGAGTAIARYESQGASPARAEHSVAPTQPAGRYVTVEVAGKKLQVNAQTLQQGPLTQEQSQQIADALVNNKSTEGLVEVKRPDGAVTLDLQDRFRNVVLAKKNDDGTVSQACVDNPQAASAFLRGDETSGAGQSRPNRKAALQQ